MAYETEHSLINGGLNNSQETANLLSPGVATIASLSSSGDLDYFKVNVSEGGLLQLDFSNNLLTTTEHWEIALLDSNGDYLTTLANSVSGSPVVSGESNTGKSLSIDGVTSSTIAANSRFTISTDGADTTIYTVLNAASVSGGAATLTLDTALPDSAPADGATLVFDPAQSGADGGSTTLTAAVDAGTYYVKVSADQYVDNEYSVTAQVISTQESSGNNDTNSDAADDNNRLIENAWMSGTLSSSTDEDVWLITTATASDIYLDFQAATGDDTSPQWYVDIKTWDGAPVTTLTSVAVSGSAGASTTFQPNTSTPTIDADKYTTAETFAVTVKLNDGATHNSGTYQLRARGTDLDVNDAPVLSVDTFSSSAAPYDASPSGVTRSIQAGADSKVQLNTLFEVEELDSGQTITSYRVNLVAEGESSASGTVKFIDGETITSYSNGSLMSAAEMANAWLYPGETTGNLTLSIQAFDSSGAEDDSGASPLVSQTIRVSSTAVAVNQSDDGTLSLVEGAILTDTGYSETLTFSLATEPTADVVVYLEQDSPNQLSFSAGKLTFTAANYSDEQTVTVTAASDTTTEGTHSGEIRFRVVSTDPDYDGLSMDALTVSLTDPVNHDPEGAPAITGTVEEDQTLTAAQGTLTDVDDLGTFSYQWQRSANASDWSEITNATNQTYTLGDTDVGNYVRVQVSYVDGIGTAESVYSVATTTVANVNDSPTTAEKTVTTDEDSTYTFQASDFSFSDNDTGDSLKAVELQGLPALGILSYNGTAVALSGGVFTVLVDDIGNLTYAPVDDANGSGYAGFDFKVVDQSDAKSTAATLTVDVTAQDDATTGSLTVSGSPASGRTLEAIDSLEDADGIPTTGEGAVSYQWQSSSDGSNWSNIDGATAASYTLTDSEVGKAVRVQASYTDNGGTANTTSSAATTTVAAAGNSAPTGSLTLTGTVTEDQMLTVSNQIADADGLGAATYSWQRSADGSTGWSAISGASGDSYTLGDDDVDNYVRVVASYTDGAGQQESVNGTAVGAVSNVNDVPVLATELADQNPAVDEVFSYKFALNSFTDADGDSLSYTATLSDDSLLPDWLSFSSVSRTFSGTPASSDAGALSIKVTADDGNGGTATDTFSLVVNSAPVLSSLTALSYTDTTAVDDFADKPGSMSATDADVDDLTFGISGGSSVSETIGFATYDVAKTGDYGTLYLKSSTGDYLYRPADGAINAINSDQSESFTMTVTDGVITSPVTGILTINLTGAVDDGYTLNGSVRHWRYSDKKLQGVEITEDSKSDTTDSLGAFSLAAVNDQDGEADGVVVLEPTLTAPTSKAEASIDLTDVLGSLKVYLGISLSSDYASPYNYMAADFDDNGEVQLNDVLELLKYYLGITTTSAPEWEFVDAADQVGSGLGTSFPSAADGTNLSKSATNHHQIDHDFNAEGGDTVELIGILRGDVDGSWGAEG